MAENARVSSRASPRPVASTRLAVSKCVCQALLALAVFGGALRPTDAVAQTTDTETRTVARDLALQGAEAYDAGDFALALDRFDRAAALVTAPTITLMQARCLVALGRWLEALDRYHQVAPDQLGPDAPDAFVRAKSEASEEARSLEGRVPRLELRLPSGELPPDVTVTLDDKPVPPVLLNVARLVDPGQHTVTTTREGTEPRVVLASLAEGEQQVVTLTLPEPIAKPVAVAPPPIVPPPQRDAAPAVEHRDERAPWLKPVAFGVGGVGVLGAVISGLKARGAQAELDEQCHPGCPQELSDTLEQYRLQRTLFYLSAGVGALGFGAGAYLVLTEDEQGRGVRVGLTTKGLHASGRF